MLHSLIIKYILNEMTFSFKPANILIQTRQTGKDLKLDNAAEKQGKEVTPICTLLGKLTEVL